MLFYFFNCRSLSLSINAFTYYLSLCVAGCILCFIGLWIHISRSRAPRVAINRTIVSAAAKCKEFLFFTDFDNI